MRTIVSVLCVAAGLVGAWHVLIWSSRMVYSEIWHHQVYSDCQCAIDFPGAVEVSDIANPPFKVKLLRHGHFMLRYAIGTERDLDVYTTDEIYSLMRNNYVHGRDDLKPKVLAEEDITVGTTSGKLYKFQLYDGSIIIDQIVIENRTHFYQAYVELPADDSLPQADVDRFLRSFRLLDQPNGRPNVKSYELRDEPDVYADLPLPAANQTVKSAAYLSTLATHMNQKLGLPKMVNDYMQEMPAKAAQGSFIYRYRLTKTTAEDFDSRSFVARVKLDGITAQCNTPKETGNLVKQGVVVHYSYIDKVGVSVTAFDVTSDDCP